MDVIGHSRPAVCLYSVSAEICWWWNRLTVRRSVRSELGVVWIAYRYKPETGLYDRFLQALVRLVWFYEGKYWPTSWEEDLVKFTDSAKDGFFFWPPSRWQHINTVCRGVYIYVNQDCHVCYVRASSFIPTSNTTRSRTASWGRLVRTKRYMGCVLHLAIDKINLLCCSHSGVMPCFSSPHNALIHSQ